MRVRSDIALLAVTLLAAAATPADAAQIALGSEGEIYRVRVARAGDVKASGDIVRDDYGALAFEVQRPGEAPEREIVPGTRDEETETNPALVFEEKTGAVFVLWQAMAGNAFPVLRLASRTTDGWSPVIELSGNPYAFKSTPQLLVMRDTLRSQTDTLHHRTVIHIVWAEEDGAGEYNTFYAPLILEDGGYIGRDVVYRVARFDRAAASPSEVAAGLLKAPRLQPGSDGNSAHLIFGDGEKGRVTTLEVRVLPRNLVALGDGARAHIIGADKLDPKTLTSLAAASRTFVLEADLGMRPAIARALADEVSSFILKWKPANGGPVALGDGARAHIIGVGSEFDGSSLRNLIADGNSVTEEIAAAAGGAAHVFRFTLTASRPAPPVGDAASYALFASADGTEATVAWSKGSRLTYRESAGAAWGAEHELQLDSDFDLEDALGVLAERTRSR